MSDLVKEGRELLNELSNNQREAKTANLLSDLLDQIEQEQEIRSSREDVISMIAGHLNIKDEPHQTFFERLLDAADQIEAKDKETERIQAIVLSKTKEYTKLYARNELLEKVVESAEFLDKLKTIKAVRGATEYYLKNKAEAWLNLASTLQALKEPEKRAVKWPRDDFQGA